MDHILTYRYIYCKDSSTHGFGIFAKEDLAPGTIWWSANPDVIVDINRNVHRRIRAASRQHSAWKLFLDAVETYAYYDLKKDVLIFCLCNARYTNHSDSANCNMTPGYPAYSQVICTIPKDTEIFENYREYDCCPWSKECSSFLFNNQTGDDDSASTNELEEPELLDMVLSKAQVDIYMQSSLDTPLQKALLTCLNEFGSFDNGIWKIAIPDDTVEQ